MSKRATYSLACFVALLMTGCGHPTVEPEVLALPSTRPTATDINPATARPGYWLLRPGVAMVSSTNYDLLVAQCKETLYAKLFTIDRVDYRSGLIVSSPLVGKQFWEFWRSDVVDCSTLKRTSVGTYRQTVQWEIKSATDGRFTATPRVVVEKFTSESTRITTVVSYRGALSGAESQASVTAHNLRIIGEDNWYAVGRDEPLEKALARDLEDRLARESANLR